MTLHWWQHWFWITGRAPVVALLLAAWTCHVWCQQPQPAWGHPGHPGDALSWWLPVQGAAEAGAPVALHVPADAMPPMLAPPWYPWAPRRLLGFAAAGDGTASPVAASESTSAAPAVPPAAAPVAVTYLTTLGPGPGPSGTATPSSSQPATLPPSSREPKAIGVLPVGVVHGMPSVVRAVPTASTTAARPPGTVTSVLEIVEELAEAATPSPSESTLTSSASPTAAGNEASAEMPNDEPAKAVSPSSAEATATEASEPSTSAASAASTEPSRMQSMSLSTAPAAASDVTVPAASTNGSRIPGGPVTSTASSAGAKADLSPTPRPGPGPAAHPGVSGPRRAATTPVPAVAPTAPAAPTATNEAPATTTPARGAPEAPHSHRSAAAPLGSASSSNARQHRVDAMSLSSGGGLDAGSITGIVLGIVVFAGLVGTVSFILYRRRYLNKPQTLNDKCSNPDSSGYIDDSTFRENSEEMYSLDNDSFLNSLEAMTIQNYWTDTVKHTKL